MKSLLKIKLLPVAVPGKADTLTLKLTPIHMTDIGKDKKVDTGELIAQILKAIAAGIAEQGKDILPTEMIGPLTDSLKETGKQIMETGQDAISRERISGKAWETPSRDCSRKRRVIRTSGRIAVDAETEGFCCSQRRG